MRAMLLLDTIPSLFVCSRCCYYRVRRRRGNKAAHSRATTSFLATGLLLLNIFSHNSLQVQAQPPPQQPSVYTPRHSAGSSIANNTLFIVSGTVSVLPPLSATADTLAIPLHSPFSTSAVPWQKLQAGYFVQDARVAATVDQKHLVLAGVGDQVGQIVVVYDLSADTWLYLPSTAVANVLPQTPRTSVGIALDPSTGQMVLYGGLLATGGTNAATRTLSLSLEFDFLDTRPTLDKWTWSAAINSVFPPPALYQPIMLYLPNQRQTLVMGGCNGINPVDGNITQCVPFSAGYLINSMVMTGSDGASVPMSRVDIKGGPPAPRLSPCTVVLASGDVFMYGGATASGSLGDAWVLNTSNWTWISKSIKNMPFPGRAGAACQLATADQIIMVGGFNGPLMGPKQFSEPQVAIINTTSWAWASDFIPSMETTPPSSLSQGVVIAIIVSGSLLLAILLSIMGRLIWQRRKRPGRKQEIFKSIRASKSSEPLMESDCYITESEVSATPMVPFSTAHLANNSIPGSISQTSLRLKEREPFLIIPYAPDTTMTYDSGSTVRMDLSTSMQSDTMVNSSVPMRSDLKISTGSDTGPYRPSGNNGESFVKGYQLPQTLADIQHGQYVKTLQHQKQYERRRRDLEQQSAHHPLHRQSTQYSFQEYDAELDGVDLATGMVHLREVDVGEEPISEAWDGIDDGTIMLSSHLDTSKLDSSLL